MMLFGEAAIVGNFDVKNTTVSGDALRGAVCVADESGSDEIQPASPCGPAAAHAAETATSGRGVPMVLR